MLEEVYLWRCWHLRGGLCWWGLCLQPGLGIAFALGEADFEVAVAAAQLVEEIFFACLWQHCHIVGELEEAAHVACLDARLFGA